MESAKNRCRVVVACALLAMLVAGVLGMGGVHVAWAAGEGTVSEVYVSQQDGDDANMGGAGDPVKTFERAKALLVKDGGTIYLSNYSVSGTQSWDLKGYTNACVKRMPGKSENEVAVGGHLISLEAGANLTLSDIVIDGWGDSANATADNRDGIICSLSNDTFTQLTLGSGCVLQNNRANQMGAAVEGYGLNLTMNEGSLIQNCSLYNVEYGGGVFIANDGTFTMNGGTISNCSANRGGGVAIIAAHMVMNGGSIENNSTYVAGGQPGYAGGIYLADYQEMSSVGGDDKRPNSIPARDTDFVMNGGAISGNSAHVYGGAICTFPQGGKHVSVEINDGEISNNQVPDGSGGGIAAFFNTSKLCIKGGSIADNSALNFGGGVFVYSMKGDKATMTSGEIARNSAGYGGGVFLDASEFEQSDGCIDSNKALLMGGGYFIDENSTLQLSSGSQVSGNGPVSTERHPSIDGDGIYVEGALKAADNAEVATNNDVYLPEGKYIEVNRAFNGASQDEPISITSEKCDVEDSAAGKIGTKLVKYDDEAGGGAAAGGADENRLFVPSSKMPEGLHIGDSHVEGDWMTYMPCFTVTYQWVGDEQPTSVWPPAATTVERDEPYSAAVQDAAPGWIFDGWYTDEGCANEYTDGSLILANTVLYGKWSKDPNYAVKLSPMDLTVYVGGNGYKGVVGDHGEFETNDLPEMGYYFALPAEVNDALGSKDDEAVNLADKLTLNYDDPSTGTTRSWKLELYGDEEKTHVTMNGRKVFIYKFDASKIDGGDATIPFRTQFTDADGNVTFDDDFESLITNQYREFTANIYTGGLDPSLLTVDIQAPDGSVISRPVEFGSATLKIRGNNEEKYAEVLNPNPSVNPVDENAMLAGVAQDGTDFYINQTDIRLTDTSGVKLMVDDTLDDKFLEQYLNQKKNPDDRFSYEFRYMDLVDTNNGNAYLTLGEGQSVNVYWPVPADAAKDSEFYIVHFKGLNRDSNMSPDEMLGQYTPEEPAAEKVMIDGKEFLKFQVSTFSPFALMYEKAATVSYEFVGDAPAGVQAPASDQVLLGKEYTAAAAPSAEGWNFDGWYTDEGCSNKYVNGARIQGDTKLYGTWSKVPVAVSYEFVGQSPEGVSAPEGATLSYGDAYTAADAPSADGWRFSGWFADEACGEPFVDGAAIKADTVLYGKWSRVVPAAPLQASVAYKFVGDAPDGVAAPGMDMVDLGAEYTAKQQQGADGYAFDGWYTDEGCSSKFVDGTAIDGNTVLYGKWRKTTPATPLKACVSYVFVGQAPEGVSAPSYDMVDLGSFYAAKAQPGVEGWSFSGWHTDKDCAQRFVDGSAVSGNMVLYGTWSKVPVTVSYEFVGQSPDGVSAPAAATLNYGDAYTAAAAPSADGWVFDGWFTDESCQTKYLDGTSIKANTALYGKWMKTAPAIPLQASVAYRFVGASPDGASAPAMDMVALGSSYNAKQQQGVDGYVFNGWYVDEECLTRFVDGTAINANTVLYGKWRETIPATPLQACVSYVFVGAAPDGVEPPSYDMVGLGSSYNAKRQQSIEGYSFDGWYIDENCTQKFVDGAAINQNIVLYGKWSVSETSSGDNPKSGDEIVETPDGQPSAASVPETSSSNANSNMFAKTADSSAAIILVASIIVLVSATVSVLAFGRNRKRNVR